MNSSEILTAIFSPPPPRAPDNAYVEQSYNSGSAPFPYAEECTLTSSTCDTSELVAQMDISGQADPIGLELGSSRSGDDAVALVGQDYLVG